MPESTPALAIPYPLPEDALVDYPALGQELAEAIEALLPRTTRGNFSAGPPANPRNGDLWEAVTGYGVTWQFRYNAAALAEERPGLRPSELELEGEQNAGAPAELWLPPAASVVEEPAELWLPEERGTLPVDPLEPRVTAYPWEFIGGAPDSITQNGYGGFQVGIWTTMNGLGRVLGRPGHYEVKGSYSLYAPAASFLIGIMVNYGGGYNAPQYVWQDTGNGSNYYNVHAGVTLVDANASTTVFVGYFFGAAPTAFYASHIEIIPRCVA